MTLSRRGSSNRARRSVHAITRGAACPAPGPTALSPTRRSPLRSGPRWQRQGLAEGSRKFPRQGADSGPVTPFTFVKVRTPPLREHVGQLPPSARVVSNYRAGGSFSFRCRFSGIVYPFRTRFAEGASPRYPTVRESRRYMIKGIVLEQRASSPTSLAIGPYRGLTGGPSSFRRQGANRGPVTPFPFEKVRKSPLLEYVGQFPPSARVVSTDRARGSSSSRCRRSGAVHPSVHASQTTHSDLGNRSGREFWPKAFTMSGGRMWTVGQVPTPHTLLLIPHPCVSTRARHFLPRA